MCWIRNEQSDNKIQRSSSFPISLLSLHSYESCYRSLCTFVLMYFVIGLQYYIICCRLMISSHLQNLPLSEFIVKNRTAVVGCCCEEGLGARVPVSDIVTYIEVTRALCDCCRVSGNCSCSQFKILCKFSTPMKFRSHLKPYCGKRAPTMYFWGPVACTFYVTTTRQKFTVVQCKPSESLVPLT